MKKSKSNNLGFTLVELIVVIALMISLLVIAIVSYVNISEGKKEESWELVKEQIETAAIDFFGANEYFFEGKDGKDVTGYVTIKKLVNDGYINRVVDPRDNKVVDGCKYVQIERDSESNAINAEFKDEAKALDACENSGMLASTTTPGAPLFEVEIWDSNKQKKFVEEELTDWLNYKKLGGNTLWIKIIPQKGSTIKTLTVDDEVVEKDTDGNYYYEEKDEGDLSKHIVAANYGDNVTDGDVGYKKDTYAPTFQINSVTSKNSKYNDNDANVNVTYNDDTSGVESVTINGTKKTNVTSTGATQSFAVTLGSKLDGVNHPAKGKATDVAGNESNEESKNYYVYKDCSNKSTASTLSGTCSNNGYRTKKTTSTDNLTGHSCGSATTTKEDCTVNKLLFALNYNAGDAKNNPGMRDPGPMASNGKGRIFNSSKGTRHYSLSKNYMSNIVIDWNDGKNSLTGTALDYCNSSDVKNCNAKDAGYTANACENVSDFERRFRFWILWNDDTKSSVQYGYISAGKTSGTNTWFRNRNNPLSVTISEDLSKVVYRYGCSEEGNWYDVRNCGKSSGSNPDVTIHVYNVKAGGKTSNTVTLYTSYFAKCGY